MKDLLYRLTFTLLSFSIAGCLTVAQKEYSIRLDQGTSGTALVRFIDIGSASEDTADTSTEDFAHLIEAYLRGTALEDQNPGFRDVRKSLREEDGVLTGTVGFRFDSLSAVRLFRYDDQSPYMLYLSGDYPAEELVETNGSYGGEQMPVIFWPKETTEFYVRTRVLSESPSGKSLLPHFRAWYAREELTEPNREQ